jgi:hypothetical protein
MEAEDTKMKDELEFDDIPSEPYYSDRTRQKIRDFMSTEHGWRWRRLQRDYKWLERVMKKTGLNPEDARYIL